MYHFNSFEQAQNNAVGIPTDKLRTRMCIHWLNPLLKGVKANVDF